MDHPLKSLLHKPQLARFAMSQRIQAIQNVGQQQSQVETHIYGPLISAETTCREVRPRLVQSLTDGTGNHEEVSLFRVNLDSYL